MSDIYKDPNLSSGGFENKVTSYILCMVGFFLGIFISIKLGFNTILTVIVSFVMACIFTIPFMLKFDKTEYDNTEECIKKYSGLKGREKTISMYTDLIEKAPTAEELKKEKEDFRNYIMNSGIEREHNVAIGAGLANGAGGAGAALVTAAELEVDNARIRQQNTESYMRNYMALNHLEKNRYFENNFARPTKDFYRKELENLKKQTVTVKEGSVDEIYKHLKFIEANTDAKRI